MAQYKYTTVLYTDTDDVVGIDESQNTTDLTDYQNNYEDDVVGVDELIVLETTFEFDIDYSAFKDLVDTPFDWTDVRSLNKNNRIELNLISSNPL